MSTTRCGPHINNNKTLAMSKTIYYYFFLSGHIDFPSCESSPPWTHSVAQKPAWQGDTHIQIQIHKYKFTNTDTQIEIAFVRGTTSSYSPLEWATYGMQFKCWYRIRWDVVRFPDPLVSWGTWLGGTWESFHLTGFLSHNTPMVMIRQQSECQGQPNQLTKKGPRGGDESA